MKMYATTTSERASKGQGGNKELVIRLDVEHDNKEREMFCQLGLEKQKDYFILYLYTDKEHKEILSLKIKGKRVKAEAKAKTEKPITKTV